MRAACRATPHWHTTDLTHKHGQLAHARAVHTCLNHCPVLAQCSRELERYTPFDVVLAGIQWLGKRGCATGPAEPQPAPIECGEFCKPLREPR